MRRKLILSVLLLATIIMSGCGNKETAKKETTLEFVQGEEVETTETTTQTTTESTSNIVEWYEDIKEASLLSMGTNGRLDHVITKLQNGEDINLVVIGGSVTEGAGASSFDKSYGDKFVKKIEEAYPDSKVNYLNAGLSGTPSSLGIIRYDNDVTDKLESDPDMVIIEFAVNDWNEETNGKAYESMIKKIMEKNDDTAVILLFAVFRNKWNLEENYTGMGEAYGLPMVSIKDGTAKAFEDGNLTDSLFFNDEYHPTSYGHTIMADCLMYMMQQKALDLKTTIDDIPEEAVDGTDYCSMHMVTAASEENIEAGSFNEKDTALQYYQRENVAAFAENWMHTSESGDESFKATFNCKNILLDYKTSSNDAFGEAEIYVDGELVRTVNGYTSSGWNNSNVIRLLEENTVESHTIEVKMAEGSEDKNFTILCIGYSD